MHLPVPGVEGKSWVPHNPKSGQPDGRRVYMRIYRCGEQIGADKAGRDDDCELYL
jgi:hypothetical protein